MDASCRGNCEYAIVAAPMSPQGDSPVFWGKNNASGCPKEGKPRSSTQPYRPTSQVGHMSPDGAGKPPAWHIFQEGIHQVPTAQHCADGCHQRAGKQLSRGAVQSVSESNEAEYKKGQK